MKWAILLFVLVYAALKLGQLAFRGRSAGYRAAPVDFGARLRAGEPLLIIGAALLTVPPAIAATSYHHHKFDAVLTHSVRCYGLISTYRGAPEVVRTNREHAVYASFEGHRAAAFDSANQLGLSNSAVRQRLASTVEKLATEQPNIDPITRRERIAATQRCLRI